MLLLTFSNCFSLYCMLSFHFHNSSVSLLKARTISYVFLSILPIPHGLLLARNEC